MRFHDAHNHLQDERFAGRQAELVAASRALGVARMVVNGSCEADWPQVGALAREFTNFVVPSFGLHPWHVGGRTPHWREALGAKQSFWQEKMPEWNQPRFNSISSRLLCVLCALSRLNFGVRA
jgi:Tat protein secretion system quality control protein TatD with DNase activity